MFLSRLKLFKSFSTISTSYKNALQHLNQRTLIEVKGAEVSDYLQGLITNDIRKVKDNVGSIYTMLLNSKGRVLYDVLLYKIDNENVYWIECDMEIKDMLQKHLKMYRIRRKIDISELNDHKLYALFNSDVIEKESFKTIKILNGNYSSDDFPLNSSSIKKYKNITIFKDPRLSHLGYRIIVNNNNSNIDEYLKNIIEYEYSNQYTKTRYSLGIGEGVHDIPSGNAFPLESNCDYLHGVSFNKGCYIGQELTARSYHTGVIRKRLMPLLFKTIPKELPENNIITHNNVNLGKLRGIHGNVGLALLRIQQVLDLKYIRIGDGEAKVIKPDWWPDDVEKDKIKMQ